MVQGAKKTTGAGGAGRGTAPPGTPSSTPTPPAGGTPPPGGYDKNSAGFKNLPRKYQQAVEGGANYSQVLKDAQNRGEAGAGAQNKLDQRKAGALGKGKKKKKGKGGPGGKGQVDANGNPIDPGTATGQSSLESGNDIDSLIKQQFEGIISGDLGRFNPETLDKMKQQLHQDTEGRRQAGEDNIYKQGARTGMFRSPAMHRRLQENENTAIQEYSRGVAQLDIEAATAEFEDKMQGLQMAQKWLGEKRQYDLGLRQVRATIQSAQIQAGATLGAAALSASATKQAAASSAGASRYGTDAAAKAAGDSLNHQKSQDAISNAANAATAAARAAGVKI